jgi:hypothetical protein
MNYLPWWFSSFYPPYLSFPRSKMTDVSHQHPAYYDYFFQFLHDLFYGFIWFLSAGDFTLGAPAS